MKISYISMDTHKLYGGCASEKRLSETGNVG